MKAKKAIKKTKKPMGRKKVFDDPAKLRQLKSLMRLKPTLEDTAHYFECGTTTIEDTIKKEFGLTFREFRDQNMVHTRLGLIRSAIQKANGGDNTMMIFCLKNLCGWRDKQPGEDAGVTINPYSHLSDEELFDMHSRLLKQNHQTLQNVKKPDTKTD